MAAFEASLGRLGLDHVDLYLIHWPAPSLDRYVETWRVFQEIADAGLARAIGVSNFLPEHLDRLARETDGVPAVNQIELHPHLTERELRAYHAEHGIVTEAYSPLGRGHVLDDPVIARIAEAHGRTPAQVILGWNLALGNVVIPKSATPERIRSNLQAVDVALSPEDLDAISALDRGERFGGDPATFVRL
jgi:diketogulonate reductase-like aldo/keto reductase